MQPTAVYVARKVLELGIVHGRSIISVVASSFHLAIKVASSGNLLLPAHGMSAGFLEIKTKQIAKS